MLFHALFSGGTPYAADSFAVDGVTCCDLAALSPLVSFRLVQASADAA